MKRKLTTRHTSSTPDTRMHVVMGFVAYDGKSKGAKNKMAKRRINYIEGNVACY